jgi:hypothetical protein
MTHLHGILDTNTAIMLARIVDPAPMPPSH